MNRGLLSAFPKQPMNQRNQTGRTRGRDRHLGPLVYHPAWSLPGASGRAYQLLTPGFVAVHAATADVPWTWSQPIGGLGNVPGDGSVVALSIAIHCQQTVVGNVAFSVTDGTDDLAVIGSMTASGAQHEIYTGKTAGSNTALSVPVLYTAGDDNTQFKFLVNWTAGTFNTYCRLIGFWTLAGRR